MATLQDGAIGDALALMPETTGDAVLDAAARCVARRGLDATSLDEVAVEAGVSRTTIYRRHGNREGLFRALMVEHAQPFRCWSEGVLVGPGTPAERVEDVLTASVLQMQRLGWLNLALSDGLSRFGVRVFKSAYAVLAKQTMERLLASMMDARARDAGVTLPELLDWLAEQMIMLASAPPWDEARLRHRLRFFVLSVIAPEPAVDQATGVRLSTLEARLDRMAGQETPPAGRA